MSPLALRVITALVLLGVFLPAVFLAPGWAWAALVAIVVGVAAHEWARLSRFPAALDMLYAVLLGLLALGLPMLPGELAQATAAALFALAALFWAVLAPAWLAFGWQGRAVFVRAAVGLTLLLPTAAALVYLREQGAGVLLGVMAVVWVADTAAYFSGRAFGRHKLAPSISPGKTWEGVAGALAALLVYAWAIRGFQSALPLALLVPVVALLFYFSVLGDLFESWIKRVAGVKDSGTLLPGHGGALDRIDALTSTLPVAAGILIMLGMGA